MAGRQGEGYGRSSIRGNQMNLGVPSAARLADGLRSVFFRAPVPSGCTLIEVESSANAVLGPAIHPRVDRVPAAETLRQTAPFATLLGHIQHRVQHLQVA